ncbi:MAG: rod shape-determining protein MreD [Gammaproteobacteria bacterium]|nr:rod shape-determining protein MreD [Gammaproteobacteria bacterium]MDD9895518.1 rod shape-determining protein MreD [Gammaproteobacteria bacterium]MDD9959845.1 rod shape-determining protein MreD [Gammaproteobacteria bacterium]
MAIQQKAHATWVIILSFFIAYLLAIVPFPDWAMNYRPEWVPMVLIYWVMALPYRIGIGAAWFAGLILDILEGSILGLNAMALVIIAYVTLSLHLRLRMFSSLQQAGLVLALVGLNLTLSHWLQIITGQTVASNLMFLMAALTSAVIWPSLFQLLRQIRRSFDVH